MATPLSKIKFRRGPKPQKATSGSESKVSDEVMLMGNYLQEQFGFAYTSIQSKDIEFSSSSLIPLFITGKKNNVPNLVSILWDIYCQWKLLQIWEAKKNPKAQLVPKNFSFEYFLSRSPLGQNDIFSSKTVQLLVNGMNEYYFNYFWPISRSTVSLINDSFLSYTKYGISISQSVNAIIGKNSDLLPLHLDFWIVPNSIMLKSNDSNEYCEQLDDVLMNIEKRLNVGNVEFSMSTIKNEKDISSIGLSQLLSRKIVEQLKHKKFKGKQTHRRLMTIIDRRTSYYDFNILENKENESKEKEHVLKQNDPPLIKCDKKNKIRNAGEKIYYYCVDNKFGAIPDDYIQEKLVYNTQQWLLPFCRIKNAKKNGFDHDGGTNFAWKNQVFLLSFHINSVSDVRVYWYLNGSVMRFLPDNMLNVWPNYFYNHGDNELEKETQQINYKQIRKEWKLKVTDQTFNQYYKELIPPKK